MSTAEEEERARYLAALEDERAERETLHPHRPVLAPRHLSSVPELDATDDALTATEGIHPMDTLDEHDTASRYLSAAEIEHGRRRITQMRALIEQNRTRRRTAS